MRIAAVIVALSSGVAAAEPPGLTPQLEPAAPVSTERLEPSYRAQTAVVDGVAVGLVFLAASTHSEGVGDLALGTYLVGAPVVHLVHNRPARAAGSLAMRVGLPVLGAIVGSKQGGCHGDVCDGDGAIALGLLAGMVAATVIDTAVLAQGDEAPARPTWSPTVAAGRSGVSLGLAASF